MYKTVLAQRTYRFASLKTLLAKASPARSGDVLAGISADSAEERMAAKMALAEVPLREILANPPIPYEADEVTRLIIDTHDRDAFSQHYRPARSPERASATQPPYRRSERHRCKHARRPALWRRGCGGRH